MSKKYLYYFSEGNDAFGGDKVTMKNTLGGKGAGLAEMTAAGMPVPQGFTITTTESAAAAMTITIIMQMKYLQAGARKLRTSTQRKSWIYFDMVPGEYELRDGEPDYTGRLCVIGSKIDEHKIEELFGIA